MAGHSATESLHKAAYRSATDPADDPDILAILHPGVWWMDTSSGPPYQISERNSTNDGWDPIEFVVSGAAPSGSAGGDLAGTYPAPTVDGLQGDALPSTVASGFLKRNSANNAWEEQLQFVTISLFFPAPTAGDQVYFQVDFNAVITKATVGLDVSGSIVLDIWKDTYANWPPTIADTITASAKPAVSSALKSQDSTLTGWTTTVNAGDQFVVNVDSVSGPALVMLALTLRRI